MSSFNARLRLPGSRLPLGVEVDIVHERMTVVSGERTLAEWPLERLDEMCGQLNALAISAPITPQTRGLIGAAQIQAMKPASYLMVMSRGNIVDETAAIAALESGQLAGAGFDVTHEEPLPPGDPLWKAPNCIITPHNSAGSSLTMGHVWRIFEENLGRFERGEPLMNVVDKQLGAIGRPGRVFFVTLLPKTRSGKVLRRSIQALAEKRDPGDLTTIEDPGALGQIREALQ